MTTFKFGDIILVPFPFTDQSSIKKRPAVVVSSEKYNRERSDIIIMAVTSRMHQVNRPGEQLITNWRNAGLLKPSVFKPILATIENLLVLRKLGRLHQPDLRTLGQILEDILGKS